LPNFQEFKQSSGVRGKSISMTTVYLIMDKPNFFLKIIIIVFDMGSMIDWISGSRDAVRKAITIKRDPRILQLHILQNILISVTAVLKLLKF
jgi:hypothetical protein